MNHPGIVTPHDHDVLSGRGNFVNFHAGNEHFRDLVKKHKVAYVACPKPQKSKFSRIIVDEIRSRHPPGRFLKQDPKTKLWYDIGEKKALDKTRQALREGAPELMKEMGIGEEDDNLDQSEKDSLAVSTSYDKVQSQKPKSTVTSELLQPEIVASHVEHRRHPPQPGQYFPQPVPIPFDDHPPLDNPLPMGVESGGRIGQQFHMPMQQQMPMRPHMNSNPAPQRLVPSGVVPSSGTVPVRSLAGIRQAMQLQAQRNNLYLQQQYHQNHQQQSFGMGHFGGTGYAGMQHMMDQFEPRPIGTGVANIANGGHAVSYEKSPGKNNSFDQVHRQSTPIAPSRSAQRTKKEMSREGSDRSINVDRVFTGNNSGHSKSMENSTISVMSLSIGEIVEKIMKDDDPRARSGDSSDPDQLATLFDSSVKLDAGEKRRKPPSRTNSRESQDPARGMDMSAMSLGADIIEIADSSVARMTESSNAMSFTSLFDNNSDHR